MKSCKICDNMLLIQKRTGIPRKFKTGCLIPPLRSSDKSKSAQDRIQWNLYSCDLCTHEPL